MNKTVMIVIAVILVLVIVGVIVFFVRRKAAREAAAREAAAREAAARKSSSKKKKIRNIFGIAVLVILVIILITSTSKEQMWYCDHGEDKGKTQYSSEEECNEKCTCDTCKLPCVQQFYNH